MQRSINNHCITARTAKCSDAALSRATSASLQQQQPLGAAAVHCTTCLFKKELFIHPFKREALLASGNAKGAPGEISVSMLNLTRYAFGDTWNNQIKKGT